MSGIDVHDLAQNELPAGRFPVDPREDFRLHLAPEVHRSVWEHAGQDLSVEICGVLVGRWERDDNGPYATVSGLIRCEQAASKFAEVTFTHDSWAQINHEMDTQFAELRIVGWYHSHPDFGIFLSERDCFIQQHFFSGPGQIAYVVDPVRELEGVFIWRDGKPQPMPHYWVGESLQTDPSGRQASGERVGKEEPLPAIVEPAGRAAPRGRALDLGLMILIGLALLVAGYMLGQQRTNWERDMVIEGTVAHYGFNKLMKIGLEENLTRVRGELGKLADAVERLPDAGTQLSAEDAQAAIGQRDLIAHNLTTCERMLAEIQRLYGLSDAERTALLRLVLQKQRELRQSAGASAPTGGPAAADGAAQAPTGPTTAAGASEPAGAPPPTENPPTENPPTENPPTENPATDNPPPAAAPPAPADEPPADSE